MQLLNSLASQLQDVPESLQTSLENIVHQVQIESHYCIKHPDYKPLEVSESAASRFRQLPLDLQNKFLSLQLRSFLYGVYYNGSLKPNLESNAEVTNLALNQHLENNSLLGVDLAFYDRLHQNNRSEGYLSHDWLVVREEIDDTLAVQRNGLTLHIDRAHHLQSQDRSVAIGNLVAIKMPKNIVQNGFYMAVGNLGVSQGEQSLVRVYFNLSPEGAVAVMDCLTVQLNALDIPFSFKVLYNPTDYTRYDSGVLYFDKSNYEAVHGVLERVYAEYEFHFSESVPLFTKLIAPGLAIAEEPNRKFGDQESFGTNRCQVIANGLLDAWLEGNNTPSDRIASILQHFSLHEIELQRPYLNANSEDIYTPIQI